LKTSRFAGKKGEDKKERAGDTGRLCTSAKEGGKGGGKLLYLETRLFAEGERRKRKDRSLTHGASDGKKIGSPVLPDYLARKKKGYFRQKEGRDTGDHTIARHIPNFQGRGKKGRKRENDVGLTESI